MSVILTVTPGTNVTLSCTNSSQTVTPLQWQHHGAQTSMENETTPSTLLGLKGRHSLVISHIGCRNLGRYVCFVRDFPQAPAREANAFNVRFPNSVPIGARYFSARLMTGRNFKLFCAAREVKKNTPLMFKWDRGGRPVAERGSVTHRYIDNDLTLGRTVVSTLAIRDATCQDVGIYHCFANCKWLKTFNVFIYIRELGVKC